MILYQVSTTYMLLLCYAISTGHVFPQLAGRGQMKLQIHPVKPLTPHRNLLRLASHIQFINLLVQDVFASY